MYISILKWTAFFKRIIANLDYIVLRLIKKSLKFPPNKMVNRFGYQLKRVDKIS